MRRQPSNLARKPETIDITGTGAAGIEPATVRLEGGFTRLKTLSL